MAVFDRGILAGRLEQALAFVIVTVRLEQSGISPHLDCGRTDVKAC